MVSFHHRRDAEVATYGYQQLLLQKMNVLPIIASLRSAVTFISWKVGW